jgi:hypothetical protein
VVSDDANTPAYTRDETFTTIGGMIMGEVTGMTLADLDNDGDRDLIVCTRTSDYNGQMGIYENRGRTAGSRFALRYSVSFGGSAPTCVATVDADGEAGGHLRRLAAQHRGRQRVADQEPGPHDAVEHEHHPRDRRGRHRDEPELG